MKVILQQDVKKVGSKGDIVEVSEGYGRNFLLPKKLAVEATAANLETAKQKANSAARKKQQATDEARLLAAQLEKVSVKVAVRIGEENPYGPLRTTSVVASSYGPSDSPAHLGIVGPTRMDYPSTMAIVRAVARYVGQFLTEG